LGFRVSSFPFKTANPEGVDVLCVNDTHYSPISTVYVFASVVHHFFTIK